MKKRIVGILLCLCMVFSIVPSAVFATDRVYDDIWNDNDYVENFTGNGTEDDPYLIETAGQLAKISKDVSGGNTYEGKYFRIENDIDLSAHRWNPIGVYKYRESTSTGIKPFCGFIDGNNKTISGLFVDEGDGTNHAGFFGYIKNSKEGITVGVKDLTISEAKVYAKEDNPGSCCAGILAGYVFANSGYQVTFDNVKVSGSVEVGGANVTAGGMIGCAFRVKATGCTAKDISITGSDDGSIYPKVNNSGGFVGVDAGSVYEKCTVSGTISGSEALGGFVGNSQLAKYDDPSTASIYTRCLAEVDVDGWNQRLGGFAGYAEYGTFEKCVATGDVTGTSYWATKIGGFVGENGINWNENGGAIFKFCHSTGTVKSDHPTVKAGGFVGHYTRDSFEDCSFDNQNNSDLSAVGGVEDVTVTGIDGMDSISVLANICEDYYGGHDLETEWAYDKTSHWRECNRCHERVDSAEHDFGDDNICVICGYKKPVVTPDTYTVTVNDSYASDTGADSYTPGNTVHIDAGSRRGYTFIGWTSSDVTISDANSPTASFTMPDANVTVTANWRSNVDTDTSKSDINVGFALFYDTYLSRRIIQSTAGEGGSIDFEGKVSVRVGKNQTFTILPDEGYEVDCVFVDGKNVGAVETYTFKNVRRDHTISVTFQEVE